ncbi:MAG: restriction endonuclease subunit S [bacterium JZ-2024 1]
MSASEGPYKLPEGWRWVRLGEIAEKPQYGYTSSAFSEPIGPKFLRITDITSGEIDWDSVPYCKIDAKVFRKYQLKPGDLLFARSGSIGATILIREVPYEAVFASYLIRVRLRVDALPEFVSLILKAPFCQKQFVPLGAAQKNINAKAIQQILLPLPPLSEQRRIVAHLEAVQARIQALKEGQTVTEAELKRLEQAILEKAFRGEL